MKIIFASQNPGKILEMAAILAPLNIEVLSAKEAGVTEDIIEDGKTFEENALKKAKFVSEKTGQWAVADDSGLCIEALNGAPGVYSARWAGKNATDEDIINFTLEKMRDVPDGKRKAWFESAAVVYGPTDEHHTFTGKVFGKISLKPVGANRPKLPYDMIFIPEGSDKTFAQMSDEEKNSLSHRGTAFKKLRDFLKTKI